MTKKSLRWVLRITVLFVTIGLFTGCASQPPQQEFLPPTADPSIVPAENLEDLHVFGYPGLEWGMTMEEVQETLGLTDSDWSLDSTLEDGSEIQATAYLDFLGQKYQTNFCFNQMNYSDTKMLTRVDISSLVDSVNPDANQPGYDKIRGQVESMLKEQGGEFTVTVDQMKPSMYYPNGVAHLYNSDYNDLGDAEWEIFLTAFHGTEGLSHLPKEYQDSYNQIFRRLVESGEISEPSGWDPQKFFDFCAYSSNPLITAEVRLDMNYTRDEESGSLRMTFDAYKFVCALSCHRTVEQEKSAK